MAVPEESVVLVDGPWTHRDVTAGGARFHAVEAGTGPLVLMLHGFPEFWWSFRHQVPALAAAGYRAVALDSRGYGASDKPPRGYDVITVAEDAAGAIRALGERDAIVIGHDWGGLVAAVLATRHPDVVRQLVLVGTAHPLQMRAAIQRDPAQRRASLHLAGFQVPLAPERWLTMHAGANVERLLTAWGGPGWPDPETARRYREAMLIPGVAHSALEYFRWAIRSLPRPDGRRALRALLPGIAAPTLQVHGLRDGLILPATARGSEAHIRASYTWEGLADAGHFPHEEAPERFNALLLRWLGAERDRDPRGRARNARPRDATGRPLPRGADGVPTWPEDAPPLPGAEAVAEAERQLAAGRPFIAHEVLEVAWKAAPEGERDLWRGLAQIAVGLTHAQRGNATGAARLLRRGADRLAAHPDEAAYGVVVGDVVRDATALAERAEAGGVAALAAAPRLRLAQSPFGKL